MKNPEKNKKQQAMIKVEGSIWEKIRLWISRIFKVGRIKEIQSTISEESNNIIEEPEEEIRGSKIIQDARKAFENYVLNREYEISEEIYNTIKERIEINKENIVRLIEIKKSEITYEKIQKILEEEKENLVNYKKTILMEKIDDKFLISEYQVPVGVIGVKVENVEEKIKNIFKAITTRNAIIVIEEAEDKQSVDKLILLIVKEALKKYGINENIIQIVKETDLDSTDIGLLDRVIKGAVRKEIKEESEKLYIYQEDEYFEKEVEAELRRLKLIGKEVELIKGKEIEEAITKINKTKNYGVSIYSQDRKKGYKFINLINSKNVFFNGTLLNAKQIKENKSNYYTTKNILCENMYV